MKSKQAKWKSFKSEKKDSTKGTKCFECQGHGHCANECANKKYGTKKGYKEKDSQDNLG